MITRFAVIPDERRLLLGLDKANLFEAGYVYEAVEILDTIVIRKLGKYSLPKEGSWPNELSEANDQVYAGLHLITQKESDEG